jgi:hypothetical protein
MTAQPLPSRSIAAVNESVPAVPKVPTVVLTAWKGGVWKTSIAVSLAERLAFAGLRVGLLATDAQQDARARLGVQPSGPDVAHVKRGEGVVVAVGLSGPQAADLLYRNPARLGPLHLVVVDTAPSRRGMRLPGTLVVVPVFDADSARNNVAALLAAPANCRIVLVKTGSKLSASDWSREVDVFSEAVDRPMRFVPKTLRAHPSVAEAHAEGRSVWRLSRRGAVKSYLDGVEALAEAAWRHAGGEGPLHDLPESDDDDVFIPGWDDAVDE